jgi:hypothetical protein
MGKTVRNNDKHSNKLSRIDKIHQRGLDELEEFYRGTSSPKRSSTKNTIKDNYVPVDKDEEIPSDEESFED